MRYGLTAVVALTCVLSLAGIALGQESRGAIGGAVVDQGGAPIPHVRVIITNIETAVDTVLETNDSGAYLAPLLMPGNYRVAADHQGFKRFSRAGISLGVNDNLQIDIRLEIGDVTQSITVTDSAPIVEVGEASLGVSVTARELTELPIAHGNPYALIALMPSIRTPRARKWSSHEWW